jgi:hypothetical protein
MRSSINLPACRTPESRLAQSSNANSYLLNTLWSGNWIRQSGDQRIIGSFNNGAVSTALGQANGIQSSHCAATAVSTC